MEQDTKKRKLIAQGLAIFASAIFLLDALLMNALGIRSSSIRANSLAILKAILIFMSAYSFIVAWFFQFRREKMTNQLGKRRGFMTPKANFLLICYLLLISPAIFGLFLYFCGMPLQQFFYFLGASIVMILLWGIYDLRRT